MAEFYERYWEGADGHFGDFPIKWPILSKLIPREKDITILDFGCGPGTLLAEIMKINPEAKYIGLDVSETALQGAKAKLPGAEFLKIEDGGKFPLPDASVDFILSSEVIEHVYDTKNAFAEIGRILRPGGKLLLTTPYHGIVKNVVVSLMAFDRHFNPFGSHVRFFTKKMLDQGLRESGLKAEKWGHYGRFYPLPHSIYVLARKA